MAIGPRSLTPADDSCAGPLPAPSTLHRIWDFARPYRLRIAAFLVTVVVGALLGLVPPVLAKTIVDSAVTEGDRRLVILLAVIAVAAAVASSMLSIVEGWLSSVIGEGLIYDLRVAIFDHVQRLPLTFFATAQTGALLSRLTSDVVGAQRVVTGMLGSVTSNVVVLMSTIGVMAALEWRLMVLAVVLVPAFFIPANRVGRQLRSLGLQEMDRNAEMSATAAERFGVAGAMLVKLYGCHESEVADFSLHAAGARDAGVRMAILGRSFFSILALVGGLGIAAVYGWGGLLVIGDTMTLGTLVALAALVTRIHQPLTALTTTRIDVMTGLVSFNRVFEVLDIPNPIVNRPTAVALDEVQGAIDYEDVWFTYPPGNDRSAPSSLAGPNVVHASPGPVLRGVSVHIAPGQLVAIVGPSGGGKTTLAGMLPRLYDVDSGRVRIDGHDVRDLTQESLRRAIGVVSQDPHLFHDTIAANLRYAAPAATIKDLRSACATARVDQFVSTLPQGYDTVVGDSGYRLSGGEKQRLSIARMVLKNPQVVVLDEATSSLDTENEAAVQAALGDALENRTALVITHRLSTIVAADLILVLDQGQIVESGKHRSLLRAGGLYADLYRSRLAQMK